jgi:hypothetical protein
MHNIFLTALAVDVMTQERDLMPAGTVDGRALRQILGMRPDLLLLGICAIDADEGLAAFYSEDPQMKSALLERSGSGILIHRAKALTTEVEVPR